MRMSLLLAVLVVAACGEEATAPPPLPPMELSREATGHFCGMVVADHPGPKAQIFVKGSPTPYWFTSVRDAKAFTLLPDEPKAVSAIYVSDMERAESWEKPGPWVAAEQAFYVIGSSRLGGMGQPEAVPFSTRNAAQAFAATHGGQVVAWQDIPSNYVLDGQQ